MAAQRQPFRLSAARDLEGTAGLEPSELPHAVHTVCNVGLWTVSKPKSLGALLAKAKRGQAAQVGIETWAPNDESPDVEDWIKREYDETTSAFLKTRFALVYKIPGKAKSLNPAGEGYPGAGVVIKASGQDTLGQRGVMESVYPPGLVVREHVHEGEDEMFYVLDGELSGFCEDERWTATAGCFVFVPRDRGRRGSR